MKWLLLLLLAIPARADTPWLDNQTYGTTPVTVKGGTIDIGTMPPVVVIPASTTTVKGSYIEVEATVTVSGGQGLTVFSATGTVVNCAILPPSPTSNYDFKVVSLGLTPYKVFGRKENDGEVFLVGGVIIIGSHKFVIENATDGTYKVMCRLRE